MLASYYWIEEAYRLHPETLKTVILDCSMIRHVTEIAKYQTALDRMRFSSVKYRAVKDYSELFEVNPLSYLIPFFEYHDRWSSITRMDFEETKYNVKDFVRGYEFSINRLYNTNAEQNPQILEYVVDPNAKEEAPYDVAEKYLIKAIEFCQERDLQLILTKVPVPNWTSSHHNIIAEIADEYGIEFLDFNFAPLVDEIGGYRVELDGSDRSHMNYYSATRLTAWFGEYLSKHCNATAVKSNPCYAYMEDQLTEYHAQYIAQLERQNIADPYTYIASAMKQPENVILITVKDEVANALTAAQREGLVV